MILTSTQKGYTFRFQSTQKVMDVENAATLPGTRVQQYEGNGDMSQIFGFAPSDDGTFWITYANDLVLTAHEDGYIYVIADGCKDKGTISKDECDMVS